MPAKLLPCISCATVFTLQTGVSDRHRVSDRLQLRRVFLAVQCPAQAGLWISESTVQSAVCRNSLRALCKEFTLRALCRVLSARRSLRTLSKEVTVRTLCKEVTVLACRALPGLWASSALHPGTGLCFTCMVTRALCAMSTSSQCLCSARPGFPFSVSAVQIVFQIS